MYAELCYSVRDTKTDESVSLLKRLARNQIWRDRIIVNEEEECLID